MKVNGRGQVTIPADLRDKFGLVPGTEVDFVDDGNSIVLTIRISGGQKSMKTLKQVKSLTDFDKRILDEVKRIVMKHLPDASLYLFGSVARGDRGPESDYDVLVLTVGDLSMTQRENVEHDLYDLELARGIAISSVYVAKRRWRSPIISAIPFQRNVKREAIRL